MEAPTLVRSGDSFTALHRIPERVTQHGPGLPETCVTCPMFEFFSRSCGHRDRRTVLDVVSDDGVCPYYDEIRREAMQELESEIEEE